MSTAPSPRPPSARPGTPRPQVGAARGPQRAASIDPFRVLRKHALLIVASMFIGGGIGVGVWFLCLRYIPIYQAFVIFEVQQGISDASDLGTGRGMREEEVSRVARTELAIIQQRNLLEAACRDPEVQRTRWFQKHYIDDAGQPMVADAVDELEKSLKTGVIRGTYLFEVRWGTQDRRDAPIVLNTIANTYITQRSRDDDAIFQKNIAAFQAQSTSAGSDIADLQKSINELILDAGITSLDDPRYSEAARALDGIIARVQANAAARNMMETQLQQIRAKLSGTLGYDDDDIRLAETSDRSLAGHIQTVNQLRVEIRTLRDRYVDDHSMVRQAGDRLRAAEAERDAQREEVIRRNLNADAKAIADQIEQIGNSLRELEDEMEDRSMQLRELATKQSEYQSMQSRLMFLEQSRESFIQLVRDVQMLRVREDARRTRIAARASDPRQIHFPRIEIIVPLGLLLITGLTIGLVFLRELTDQRVKSASDLLVVPGASILGIVPEAEEDPTRIKSADLVVRDAPHSVLAESWRQAGTQMLRGIDQAGHQSVVFIGGMPGSGATTAVTNLACAFSAAGRRVVVVEGNFRRPRIAALLGLNPASAGLGDLLQDVVTLEEALQVADHGFAVITAGTPKARIVERLTTTRMAAIVAELRSRFDLVLFDAPPAVIAGDAIAIANVVDSAVLIVRANQEERGLVARVISQVQRAGCDLLGVVLNRPRRTAGGYFKRNFAAMAAYRSKTEGVE